MTLVRAFSVRVLAWSLGLLLLHSGLRAVAGIETPWPFVADLLTFAGPVLVVGAFAAGVGSARLASQGGEGPSLGDVARLSAAAVPVGALAFVLMSWASPATMPDDLRANEPRAATSAEIRAHLAGVADRIEAEPVADRAEAWQAANGWAFEHERRIVQSLLVPVLAVIGFLVGIWSRSLGRPFRPLAIWGAAFFLIVTMYFAGENGFELIVLRSAGPMAFVAWLQLIVPGAVLVGLLLPTATRWGAFAAPDGYADERAEGDRGGDPSGDVAPA